MRVDATGRLPTATLTSVTVCYRYFTTKNISKLKFGQHITMCPKRGALPRTEKDTGGRLMNGWVEAKTTTGVQEEDFRISNAAFGGNEKLQAGNAQKLKCEFAQVVTCRILNIVLAGCGAFPP